MAKQEQKLLALIRRCPNHLRVGFHFNLVNLLKPKILKFNNNVGGEKL